MPSAKDIFYDVICGSRDSNIRFHDLCKLLETLGFSCMVKGDHFIWYREDVEEIINIQPEGNKAKPYQVKQVRRLITQYKLEVQ